MTPFPNVWFVLVCVVMKTVYIETSVVSYLTARPARDLLAAAWQAATNQWWEFRREQFELYTSQLVVEEANQGDAQAAAKRTEALRGMSLLPVSSEATELADALLRGGALPEKAADDALHVAISAFHGIDYLLTWNCRHIDNAEMKPFIRGICAAEGYACPEICTPLELMGDEDER